MPSERCNRRTGDSLLKELFGIGLRDVFTKAPLSPFTSRGLSENGSALLLLPFTAMRALYRKYARLSRRKAAEGLENFRIFDTLKAEENLLCIQGGKACE